jgi:magnesium transporter
MTQDPAAAAYAQEPPPERVRPAFRADSEFTARLHDALERGDAEALQALVCALHEADQAEIFNQLGAAKNTRIAQLLGASFNHDVLPELEPDVVEEVLEGLGRARSAEVIAALEREDAVQIIEDMPQDDRRELLETLDTGIREELEEGLSYPESSAGRLMRKKMVSVPLYWTVGDVIDHMRARADLPDDFYVVFVVDPKFHPIGAVQLARVMSSQRDVLLSDLMERDAQPFSVTLDQEEVAYVFRKYGLVEAPVVNESGRLVGAITVDDVVEVMNEEREEDILRAAGVSGQELLHTGIAQAALGRLPWLVINLLTAVAASAIIDLYQETIQQLVLLAVLMPIIASMGGNAGIQAATIAVRSIATRRLGPGSEWGMMRREAAMGALNGLALAVFTGLGIFLYYGNGVIALVFAAATVLTMIIAGLSGVLLPLAMLRLRVDPAISAGVFLTMLTDIVGFLAFLGLASFVLHGR